MHVRVYLVGWMKAIAGAVLKYPPEPTPESTVLSSDSNQGEDEDDSSEDRDTWPEAGLTDSRGMPIAEVRIDLAGSPNDLDSRAQDLLAAIEREVLHLTREWDCSVRVTQAKD